MLDQLQITNLALIDQVTLSFSKGLNILSGETGAGKSIIIKAVNLLLGEKPSPDTIRQGAEEARVEALFSLPVDHPLQGSPKFPGSAGRDAGPGQTYDSNRWKKPGLD